MQAIKTPAKRARVTKTILAAGETTGIEDMRAHENTQHQAARLKFSDNGDLANLTDLHRSVHALITLAANHFIALVAYTQESPFPPLGSDAGEGAGRKMGEEAFHLALSSSDDYSEMAARVEGGEGRQPDTVPARIIGKYVRVRVLLSQYVLTVGVPSAGPAATSSGQRVSRLLARW